MTGNPQKQTESPTVGAGELGKMLGRAITSTPEYRAYAEAEGRYQDTLRPRRCSGSIRRRNGPSNGCGTSGDHTQEVKRLEELQAALDANQRITVYFDAEEKLVALLRSKAQQAFSPRLLKLKKNLKGSYLIRRLS